MILAPRRVICYAQAMVRSLRNSTATHAGVGIVALLILTIPTLAATLTSEARAEEAAEDSVEVQNEEAKEEDSKEIVAPDENSDSDRLVTSALKLANEKTTLETVFGSIDEFRTILINPRDKGGTTFTGLVAHLMGEALNRTHEGYNTEKVIYQAWKGKTPIGAAMGSRYDAVGNTLEVFVFYNANGTIRDLQVLGLPKAVAARFASRGYLKQFIGRHTEELENRRLRKGRRAVGAFLKTVSHPSEAADRPYFTSVLRSVRFNAAFMDVAYFITKYPNQVSVADNRVPPTPLNLLRQPLSGPEAYLRERTRQGASFKEGRPQ